MPDTPVAHGDRRKDVWIEDDQGQLSKVRHTWPTSREGAPAGPADVTDAAVVPEESSAWEAVEDDD